MDELLVPIHGNKAGGAIGGVSRSTVYRLADAGELVLVNVGTRAFITAESIRAYVDRITAKSESE